VAREGESDAWWVAKRNGQMLNPHMWSLNLFKALLANLGRKQKERFWTRQSKRSVLNGGADAVPTLEVILRGKVIRGSTVSAPEQKNHRVFNLYLRSTAQDRERDYRTKYRASKNRMRDGQRKRKRHRWLLKCVIALV